MKYKWHLDWLFPSRAAVDAFIAHTSFPVDLPPQVGPDDQPIAIYTEGNITEREEEELAAVAVLYEGRILRRELRRVPQEQTTP